MKGVVLVGGYGTRLRPITKIINKNLLLVYDKPLVYYPILTLRNAGIKDILIVCGPEYAEQYVKLMGVGSDLGVNLSYTIQAQPMGIAHGLGLARHFSGGDKLALILGDNIFGDNFKNVINRFKRITTGAMFFLKKVDDPSRFGVAELSKNNKKLLSIIEKPLKPKSKFAVTGLYLYDNRVFEIVDSLKPSNRGEFEITDVNNFYVKEGTGYFFKINKFWIDAGTFDSLLEAGNLIAKNSKN
ncbi:MAG: NTP transferase domain-containing protein [Parcubacteria group bacterium]|nr:NTP transferase domain-containing protein [Parcubacteria group bacterium]